MIPEGAIVSYTYVEVEEKYELYVMLLHSIDLYSIVLFTLDKCVCVYLLILLENFIHSEVKHIALSLIGFTAISKKMLIVLLKTMENERKGILQPCKEDFI